MKKVIGIVLFLVLFVLSLFIDLQDYQDSDFLFWRRIITFLCIVAIILILIRKFKVNIPNEVRTFFKFKEDPEGSKRSMRILVGGTVIPIVFSLFIIGPVSSFTLIKINASDYHKSNLRKNKVVRTYQIRHKYTRCYVDIVYDGKPVTIKIPKKMKTEIDKHSQLPNLNRGRLGFYFIRD